MYALYVNEETHEIKVARAHKALQHLKYTDEITRYNDLFFICAKKKPLIEKAQEIKSEWISKAENKLNLIKNIQL